MTQEYILVSPNISACLKPGAAKTPRLRPADLGDTTKWQCRDAWHSCPSPIVFPATTETTAFCVSLWSLPSFSSLSYLASLNPCSLVGHWSLDIGHFAAIPPRPTALKTSIPP